MRRLIAAAVVLVVVVGSSWGEPKKESPVVARSREKLMTKVTVDYKDTYLKEIKQDLEKQVDNLSIYIDTSGGVSMNQQLTYAGSDKPLVEVLDEMFKKADLGYVIGKKGGRFPARYEGWLIIVKGKARGDEDEPATTTTTKPAGEKPTGEKPTGEKPATTDKPPKETTPPAAEADPDKAEKDAARKLKFAQELVDDGKVDKAEERLEELIKAFPNTKAAAQAKLVLEKLNQ